MVQREEALRTLIAVCPLFGVSAKRGFTVYPAENEM